MAPHTLVKSDAASTSATSNPCSRSPEMGDELLNRLATDFPDLEQLVLADNSGNLWSVGKWTRIGLEELRRRRHEVEVRVVQ